MSPRTTQHRGFTLVELLVVIGIIALLISILLPALNRARGAALSLDCQARMRQMGQAIHLYAADWKGVLPATNWEKAIDVPTDYWLAKDTKRHITSVLSNILGAQEADLRNLNPVFEDHDVEIVTNPANSTAMNHYNFNLIMFIERRNPWVYNKNGQVAPPLRSITKFKKSSEMVAAWDGWVRSTSWYGHAHPHHSDMKDSLGEDFWYATNFDSGISWHAVRGERNPARADKYPEKIGGVDFRHLNRTSTNVLFLDGHVESRREGDLYLREFSYPYLKE